MNRQHLFSKYIQGACKFLVPYITPPEEFKVPFIDKHPLASDGKLILPPYLGEMGLEIRGFLGQVEPWLRAGWLIPAKRPILYPNNSAFNDPPFFERVSYIKKELGLQEIVGSLVSQLNFHVNSYGIGYSLDNITIELKGVALDYCIICAKAENALRRLYLKRYGNDSLTPTLWDLNLTGLSEPFDFLIHTARHALPPSYLPQAPLSPFNENHIGLQIRNLPQNPGRNSNTERMIKAAQTASNISGFPIIVYGHGDDIFPSEFQRSVDLIPTSDTQLTHEIGLLKFCKLMVAPDSGWADLMGWLRIPCLAEQQFYSYGYSGLSPFRPKILLLSDSDQINMDRIDLLLKSKHEDFFLPDPLDAIVKNSHLDPNNQSNLLYWDDYN